MPAEIGAASVAARASCIERKSTPLLSPELMTDCLYMRESRRLGFDPLPSMTRCNSRDVGGDKADLLLELLFLLESEDCVIDGVPGVDGVEGTIDPKEELDSRRMGDRGPCLAKEFFMVSFSPIS